MLVQPRAADLLLARVAAGAGAALPRRVERAGAEPQHPADEELEHEEHDGDLPRACVLNV